MHEVYEMHVAGGQSVISAQAEKGLLLRAS